MIYKPWSKKRQLRKASSPQNNRHNCPSEWQINLGIVLYSVLSGLMAMIWVYAYVNQDLLFSIILVFGQAVILAIAKDYINEIRSGERNRIFRLISPNSKK